MAFHCIRIPQIVLPSESVDMQSWAVIACDQHTSDVNYWIELEKFIGNKPSTLRLTLPEIYLQKESEQQIAEIQKTMREYKAAGIFHKLEQGMILVERKTNLSPMRRGIVLSIDLESYSFEKKSSAAVRATEATIVERIPPRIKIRDGAIYEFPHIMLLYNDPTKVVLSPILNKDLPVLYDFDLNMNGGHVCGKWIGNDESVLTRFESLVQDGLLFMVGDGNHSLATAKSLWDNIKISLSDSERENHPARFALCEAVNLYDDGINFEAIHRIVKNVNAERFVKGMNDFGNTPSRMYKNGISYPFFVADSVPEAVAGVDAYIQNYIESHGGSVDYIHGETDLRNMTAEDKNCVGICLPKMDKSELFKCVKEYGSLPRKTFSMGESEEKRYYIEGKEIL